MTNLYEILEVSKKASKEVIDKAYHVLAKKYHPDLQLTEAKKKQAEAKMKKINEAYNILGNEQKRKIYDLKLEQEIEEQKRRNKIEQFEKIKKYENMNQNTQRNSYTYNREQYSTNKTQEDNMQKIQSSLIGTYKKIFGSVFEKRVQRTRQPWNKERVLGLLKGLGIVAIIIIVLFIFPPTNKLIVGFYEKNPLVKSIVDILGKIIFGIFEGIGTFFKNIFSGR